MGKDLSIVKDVVFICNGGSCLKKGAEENTNVLRNSLKENNLSDTTHTIKTRCSGQCEHGPMVFVFPDGIWYKEINLNLSKVIVESHLIKREYLNENIFFEGVGNPNNTIPSDSIFNTIKKVCKKAFRKLYLMALLLVIQTSVFAQSGGIDGFIRDHLTNESLSGASILLEKIGRGTTTNPKGYFTITKLTAGEYFLLITMIGYSPYRERIKIVENSNIITINVLLKQNPLNLAEVTVSNLTNIRNVNKLDLIDIQLQPVKSAQDLLRAIPGLFIAQHAGGGKAEQIFVRGNDNDHGTDFAIFWDGIPINMPTHAHGQGYADMHFIIPELTARASFYKGPYEAKLGDFSISGAAFFNSKYQLEKNTLKIEYGKYNSQRLLAMINLLGKKHINKTWKDNAYFASDYTYNDGFFKNKLNFNRFNLFGRYDATLSESTNLTFTTSTFLSSWYASGQIPLRALETGLLSRYGSVDNSEGGSTSRTNLNLKLLTSINNNSSIINQLYYSKNLFNLFSNFTFFMNDTINGDEIRQWEKRDLFGYKGTYNREDLITKSTQLRTEIGFTTRTDFIKRGKDHVRRREYLSTDSWNNANITNYSFYIDENWQFHPKWNLNIGLRNDLFDFQLNDKIDANNSGRKWVYRFNPKLNLYFDVLSNVTLYFKSGFGFHSNFIQAVLSKSADADPVPQSYGSDLGSNFKIGQRTVFSLALWWLHVGSEYKFIADNGSFENIGNSKKVGIDLSMRYQMFSFLWADVNINYAKGILLNAPANENLLPLHPKWNSTGGITYKLQNGLNGSLRYRYLGPRPANSNGSIEAKPYFIMDAVAKLTRAKYEIGLSLENILNKKWDEAQFYDFSRLQNEKAPVEDFHITPGTPFYLKGMISYFF